MEECKIKELLWCVVLQFKVHVVKNDDFFPFSFAFMVIFFTSFSSSPAQSFTGMERGRDLRLQPFSSNAKSSPSLTKMPSILSAKEVAINHIRFLTDSCIDMRFKLCQNENI